MDPSTQTGVSAEAAVQPGPVPSQPGVEKQEDQMVPLAALQAERRERQQLQESQKAIQDHLALLEAQMAKKQKQDAPRRDPNDVLTWGDFEQAAYDFKRESQMETAELKMALQNPDYNEVVRKYLPDVIKNDPDLKDFVLSAKNPFKAAYHLAKRSDGYLQEQKEKVRSQETSKVASNLQKPGNLSSLGGATSGSSMAGYKNMSDTEFRKLVNKNMGYA